MIFQISLGEILLAAVTIVSPILGTLLLLHRQNTVRMAEVLHLLNQFPLHLHVNGKIVYPAGTVPGIVLDGSEIRINGK